MADPDGRVRAQAVLALGRQKADDAETVALLTRALSDDWPDTRALAARALGWLGAPARPAVPALNGRLRDDEPRVRREAEKALRRIQLGLASEDESGDEEGAARPAAPPGAGGQ
jgi:HEAT repeat protein